MDKKFKECMKPHFLVHNLAGIGIGLILVSFIPVLVDNALMLGLVVFVAAVVGDFMVNK